MNKFVRFGNREIIISHPIKLDKDNYNTVTLSIYANSDYICSLGGFGYGDCRELMSDNYERVKDTIRYILEKRISLYRRILREEEG